MILFGSIRTEYRSLPLQECLSGSIHMMDLFYHKYRLAVNSSRTTKCIIGANLALYLTRKYSVHTLLGILGLKEYISMKVYNRRSTVKVPRVFTTNVSVFFIRFSNFTTTINKIDENEPVQSPENSPQTRRQRHKRRKQNYTRLETDITYLVPSDHLTIVSFGFGSSLGFLYRAIVSIP